MVFYILSYVNSPQEMDIDDILDLAVDANQPGARVDFISADSMNEARNRQIDQPHDIPDDIWAGYFKYGVVVVWRGYTRNSHELADAVVSAARSCP
jgi:hypothetical protein